MRHKRLVVGSIFKWLFGGGDDSSETTTHKREYQNPETKSEPTTRSDKATSENESVNHGRDNKESKAA